MGTWGHKYKIIWPLLFLLLMIGAAAVHLRFTPDEPHYTIGVLNYSRAPEPALTGLQERLTELGYPEGDKVTYVYRGPIHDQRALRQEGERLAGMEVDLLFSMTTPATLVAKEVGARYNIPVIFAPVSNAVGSGIVNSLVNPGGNLSGITFSRQELERLHLFHELLPDASRFLVPYNPNDPSPKQNIARLRSAAMSMGVQFVEVSLHDTDQITRFLEQAPDVRVDAVFLPTDSLMASRTRDFARFARQYQLPLTTPNQEGVSQGALFSYGMSVKDVGRQAARLVLQVFNGIPASHLPVEEPEYRVSLNLDTARFLGLSLPDSFVRHAVLFPDGR